jgi:hypothetical protein
MGICFSEPTIDELLDDSLTQGLMRADGVDAAALRSMLLGLASSIEARPAVQRDRMVSNRVLAWGESAVFPRGAPAIASVPANTAGTPNPCMAC